MRMFQIDLFNENALNALLESVVRDCSREERIMMLFGILDNLLKRVRHDEDARRKLESVHLAVDVVNFLKSNLGVHKDPLFNAAYKRFYTAIHRRIIDAYKHGANEEFDAIRASIAKLTSPPFSKSFFSNFTREAAIDDEEIVRFLLSPGARSAALSARVQAPAHHSTT